MNDRYDVIVAGAGMAGTLAAAASAKAGCEVLLLDRNSREYVGKKTNWGWVCGDAVATAHLEFIRKKLGLKFAYPELDNKLEGIYAISPDFKTKAKFQGEGYILNRPIFEEKLLDLAIKNGATYMPKFEVERPIMENNFVVGVAGKDEKVEHKEFRAKVVIDALGVATTLRRALPENPYVDRAIDIEDMELTGRFLYEFDLDHEDRNFYDPKFALIHLNQDLAPGGYGWVFPKHGNIINVGIGLQRKSLEMRNKKFGKTDTLQTLMKEYVNTLPVFRNLRMYNEGLNKGEGYWSVAVRRHLESLVFNGYMGAGDSMAMPNPVSAGGIGSALTAGVLAGENAAKAIQQNDVSIKGLWSYNNDFNEEYGKKSAGLEVFRVYLQSLNNGLLNYGMKVFVTAAEADQLARGLVPELTIASGFKTILKGATNVKAFTNLLYAVNKMKKLNQLYESFPSVEGFPKWRELVAAEIKDVKARFKPNPV